MPENKPEVRSASLTGLLPGCCTGRQLAAATAAVLWPRGAAATVWPPWGMAAGLPRGHGVGGLQRLNEVHLHGAGGGLQPSAVSEKRAQHAPAATSQMLPQNKMTY
jgi:hypothetical protein